MAAGRGRETPSFLEAAWTSWGTRKLGVVVRDQSELAEFPHRISEIRRLLHCSHADHEVAGQVADDHGPRLFKAEENLISGIRLPGKLPMTMVLDLSIMFAESSGLELPGKLPMTMVLDSHF